MSETSVGIVGLGLIGGSLGLALRAQGTVVWGMDERPEVVARAVSRGAVTQGCSTLEALSACRFIVIATPLSTIVPLATTLFPHLQPGTVVVDTGSVKSAVVSVLAPLAPPDVTFVGGHPMFGTALQGIEAAQVELVSGAPFILTPTASTPSGASARVEHWAAQLKMLPIRMSPEAHDEAVARVSHLNYLVAAALTRTASRLDVVGPSFRDATRLVTSPPELWDQILTLNDAAVRQAAADFVQELEMLLALSPADRRERIRQAQQIRQSLSPQCGR